MVLKYYGVEHRTLWRTRLSQASEGLLSFQPV